MDLNRGDGAPSPPPPPPPSAAPAAPRPAGTWSTLRHPAFRGLWACGGLFFLGNAMQSMTAAWMMVELTGSAFLAALVQTAVFLPMFLLSLPAGVLADTADRRRTMSWALGVQAASIVLLCTLLLAGLAGPATVLFFIFVAGCCTALMSPAWNSTIGDSIPREELPQAITAISINWNAARAVGPALAGVVFAQVGGAWNFVLAALGTVGMLYAIRRWPPAPHPPSRLPPERLVGRHAERAALRPPFGDRARPAGAHRGLQRRRLGPVGAAAGDRPAPARARRHRLWPADGLPRHRCGRGGAGDRAAAGARRAGGHRRQRGGGVRGGDADRRAVALGTARLLPRWWPAAAPGWR